MKLDILAFGAHPDDVELGCAGTLLKHLHLNNKVGIIDLTRGELGTRGTPEIRATESIASTKLMGIHARETLSMEDGLFEINSINKIEIIKKIRKYQPEIVLANAISDRHPDHGRASQLISESCFLSGLIKVKTIGDDNESQNSWKPKAVYHYIQDRYIKPDFVIDVSQFMEKKIEVIKSFKSQFYNPDSDEPETPISTKDFMDFLLARSIEFGRIINVQYAEGYTTERPVGLESLFDLI
jgi:bacillithiol biosynthesis deacetylase BshB1